MVSLERMLEIAKECGVEVLGEGGSIYILNSECVPEILDMDMKSECRCCGNHEKIEQDSPLYDNHPIIYILKDGRLYTQYERFFGRNQTFVKTYYNINYCPMCGRKLGE